MSKDIKLSSGLDMEADGGVRALQLGYQRMYSAVVLRGGTCT